MRAFLVFRNADFTEGRGPMLYVDAYASYEGAAAYIDARGSGISGAKPTGGMTLSEWCMSGIDSGWGGYEIKEVELK